MPTVIHFTGGEESKLRVAESPEEVQSKLNAEHGNAFQLTPQSGRGTVFVNPGAIAWWEEAEPVDPASMRIEQL
jgi:hypothetical protein